MRKTTRREALRMMAAGTAGAVVLPAVACSDVPQTTSALVAPADGQFVLPDLPYDHAALEPVVDTRTMEIHHGRHHQGYVNKLNAALEEAPGLQGRPLDDLLADLSAIPESIRTAVRNSGGGHLNHSLFWTMMSPNGGGEPSGELGVAITRSFGSFNAFKEAFQNTATGVFGSGWGWLVADSAGALSLVGTPNQDSPVSSGMHPVLGIDVWEHAYYLHYQNRRADYVAAFFDVVNWDRCGELYDRAVI